MTGGTHLLRTDVQSTLIEDGPTCRGPGAGSYGHAGAGHAARFSGWGRTLAPRPVGERGAPEEPPGAPLGDSMRPGKRPRNRCL
jgi:hypothetical protein